ncbi:MAG: exodeoxyribonuclease VII large subunit, partial [Solirubrobacterales bacterium]|nr:exodeoxyribonuclease VII large subunit [Solirubrobacterales bacterium]
MADELEGFPAAAVPAAAAGGSPDDAADGLSGPFAVGRYARGLRDFLRKRDRLRLIGEITGLRVSAKAVYFELRDAEGAVPCAMWRDA